jgi:hypothetical protein
MIFNYIRGKYNKKYLQIMNNQFCDVKLSVRSIAKGYKK